MTWLSDAAGEPCSAVPATRVPHDGRWPEDVAVWQIAVPAGAAERAEIAAVLDPFEQQRAQRYRQPADQDRFTAARHALRCLLGASVKLHPADLRFAEQPNGKPWLPDYPQWSFNVSHSGARALIAISPARRVGVDVERIDDAFDWTAIAGIVCSEDERQALQQMHASVRLHAFLRVWTAKEALVKGIGVGIGDGLPDISVDLSAPGTGRRASAARGSPLEAVRAFQYCWLNDEQHEYVGCIAFDGAGA